MYRLFRVHGKGRFTAWVAARDAAMARQYAVKRGYVRSAEQVRVCEDLTNLQLMVADLADSLREILSRRKPGLLSIRSHGGSSGDGPVTRRWHANHGPANVETVLP